MGFRKMVLVAVCLVFATSANAGDMVVRGTWYHPKYEGRTMKNGLAYHRHDATIVASRDQKQFPIGARLRATNLANGCTHEVIVQDKSPYVALDFSEAAAQQLCFKDKGRATLRVAIISNRPKGL